jgi:hypothetical protein
MNQILVKGIPTLEAMVSKNLTRPDNVFCSSSLVDTVLKCGTDPGKRPPHTDYMPIATTVDVSFTPGEVQPCWNFRAAESGECETELQRVLAELPAPKTLMTEEEFQQAVVGLTSAILRAVDKAVPVFKKTPYTKSWWNDDIRRKRKEMRRAWRKAVRFRDDRNPISYVLYQSARNAYAEAIEDAKKAHWKCWVEDTDSINILVANRMVTTVYGDRGKTRLPSLKSKKENGETETHKSNGSKAALLHKGFFPTAKATYGIGSAYANPKFTFKEIQDVQIIQAIQQLSLFKAPGYSGLANALLKKFPEILAP